eukprot:4655381-Prymnesium_polylepis.1
MLRHGWAHVAAAVPAVRLHVYYGWATHELIHPRSRWRDAMRGLLTRLAPGVVEHGRVGQRALCAAKARAQLHYYVGTWPEIDCIAARESAMLRCVPLTSSVAVFGDPAKDYCLRVPGDPAAPRTQRAAAGVAIRLLQAHAATGGRLSSVTDTLRGETWDRVAARWLAIVRAAALEEAEGGGAQGGACMR